MNTNGVNDLSKIYLPFFIKNIDYSKKVLIYRHIRGISNSVYYSFTTFENKNIKNYKNKLNCVL